MNHSLLRYILLTLILFLSLAIKSETVVVQGVAEGHEGCKISLFTFKDIYTQTSNFLCSTYIDDSARFELKIDVDKIEYAFLRFNFLSAPLYLHPGKSYSINILPLEEKQSKSFSNKTKASFTFDQLEKDDINALIIDFNLRYDQFFNDHFELLQKFAAPSGSHFKRKLYQKSDTIESNSDLKEKRNREKLAEEIQKFEIELDLLYAGEKNEFFSVYRKMVMADLQMNIVDKPLFIYENYLKNTPLSLDNPEYVKFFKRFYRRYFAVYTEKWGRDELADYVSQGDAQSILTLLEKDDFVEGENVKHAILAHAVYEVRRNRRLRLENFSKILNWLIVKGLTQEIKNLAHSADLDIKRTRKGFAAYDFELRTYLNELDNLSNYKGKYVYLNFWADWCSTCKKEIQIIADLHEKYGKHISFISINMDDDESKLTEYLSMNKDFNWTFLYGKDDERLAEEYNLVSLPEFYLINENGEFFTENVQMPSKGLENTLYKLFQEKEHAENPKRKVGSK